MARILLTAGPTRAYLDEVRFLTNGSSGRMARALARAALDRGHQVTIVSGPVTVRYPAAAKVVPVTTTSEMLAAALAELPRADGVIGAAAPCDFEPARRAAGKIPRAAGGLTLALRSSPDVIATLAAAAKKTPRGRRPPVWCVAFALEPAADKARACAKLTAKHCDLIVVNDPTAVDSATTRVAVYDARHALVGARSGRKAAVASWLVGLFDRTFA